MCTAKKKGYFFKNLTSQSTGLNCISTKHKAMWNSQTAPQPILMPTGPLIVSNFLQRSIMGSAAEIKL
jgi:hypothetical protein